MKSQLIKIFCVSAIWAFATVHAAVGGQTGDLSLAPTEPSSPWSADIVPYLWLAGYDGTFGLSGVATTRAAVQSETTDSFDTHLSATFMLTAQVRYRNAGLYLDGAWLQLKTEGSFEAGTYSGAEITTDIAFGAAALSYRLPGVGGLQADLLAGARHWYVANEIEFGPGTAPGYTADSSRNWTDPIVGAHLQYDLSKHWFGVILGDVGGFGVGSDMTWQVFGGVGYRFTSWMSATLGYRYLHVDYDKDDFLMNANVQGFLFGLGFHF